MEGADIARDSRKFFKTVNTFKQGDIFMAYRQLDPVLGPPVMDNFSQIWKNGCVFFAVEKAGHFVQEWGK